MKSARVECFGFEPSASGTDSLCDAFFECGAGALRTPMLVVLPAVSQGGVVGAVANTGTGFNDAPVGNVLRASLRSPAVRPTMSVKIFRLPMCVECASSVVTDGWLVRGNVVRSLDYFRQQQECAWTRTATNSQVSVCAITVTRSARSPSTRSRFGSRRLLRRVSSFSVHWLHLTTSTRRGLRLLSLLSITILPTQVHRVQAVAAL